MNNKILKDKNFLLLLIGTFVSLIGTEIQNFALSLYVLSTTGSAAKFASVLAASLIPKILLGPFAGVFVDWFDRKKIIVYLDMLNGVVIAFAALIYYINGSLSMTLIYAMVIALSIVSLLFQPAMGTIVPSIIGKDKLIDANGAMSIVTTFGYLIAPILAGIIMGFGNIFVVLVINSFSFFLSSFSEMFIKIPKVVKKHTSISVKAFIIDFKEGIVFLIGNKLILSITIVCMVLNFTFNPLFSIGVPYILKQVLLVTDVEYGIFNSVLITSMFLAPTICSKLTKKVSIGKLSYVIFSIVSLIIILYGVIPSNLFRNFFPTNFIPYLAMIILGFIIALLVSIGNIAILTITQKEIPLDLMGRVKSTNGTLIVLAIPFGQIIFGYLYDQFDSWIVVMISGLIMLAAITLFKNPLLDKNKTNEEKLKTEKDFDLDYNKQ